VSMAVIAIDGPAGAGKSTVARQVALATGLPYLDTGAMYRCVALLCLRHSIDINDAEAVGSIAASAHIVVTDEAAVLNGEDISAQIRTQEISGIVSIIATHSSVRQSMRDQQRAWVITHGGGVVEGRDIGTVVIPDADLKIFLTASPEVRAARRVVQSGGDVAEVAASIRERDRIDSTRDDSPLMPASTSIHVDSSNKTIEEVVAEIVHHYRECAVPKNG
jgi:cytidylate kinase